MVEAVARLVVAHRFKHGDVGPFAVLGWLAVLLEHLAHRVAKLAKLIGLGADNMARHDRGGCLAKRAGFDLVGKVRDRVAVHLEVDRDGRSAELGMGRGAGVGTFKPAQPGNTPRQFQNPAVVDLVQHGFLRAVFPPPAGVDCFVTGLLYIWPIKPAQKSMLGVWLWSVRLDEPCTLGMRRSGARRAKWHVRAR